MKKYHYWVNTLLIIAVLILVLVGGNQSAPLGGSTSDSWSVGGALTVTGASTLTGDATFSGGDGGIVVTTSNSATSSIEVGCIQTYATSTATALKLNFVDSATTSIYGTAQYLLGLSFGTCP